MFQSNIVRWESTNRWYEASIICDLLGDWMVIRRWGGLRNRRGGHKIDHFPGYLEACSHMEMIDRRRRYRRSGYQRLNFDQPLF